MNIGKVGVEFEIGIEIDFLVDSSWGLDGFEQ